MPLRWHNQSWKNLEEGCGKMRLGVCRRSQLVLVVKGLLSTLSLTFIFCCLCRFQNKSCVTVINMLPFTSALKAPSPELFVKKEKKMEKKKKSSKSEKRRRMNADFKRVTVGHNLSLLHSFLLVEFIDSRTPEHNLGCFYTTAWDCGKGEGGHPLVV